MTLFDIIQQNFVVVAITLFLFLFILTNNNFEKDLNRLFMVAALSVLLLVIEEAWEGYLSLSSVYEPLRVPLSAIGYTLRSVIPYVLTMIVNAQARKHYIPFAIPLVINMLVCFSALFTDLAFSYTPDNSFDRGPLGLTPFFVAGFYVLTAIVSTIRECRKGERLEAMVICAIAILALTATIMESVLGFRGIQNPSIAISITFYYLFLHTIRNNRDILTGSLNRRRFYLDANKYQSSITAVISLDVNDLKLINDQKGHLAGDEALTSISAMIKRYMGSHASLYRIGGDEFMILCYKLSEENVMKLIGHIQEDLGKTDYRCGIGYALNSNKISFDEICQIADNAMYENKRKIKEVQ